VLTAKDRVAYRLRVAAAIIAVVAISVTVYLVASYQGPTIDAKTLATSLDREIGVVSPVDEQPCRQQGSHVWLCSVYDTERSGSATYRVLTTSSRCWHASWVADGGSRDPGSMPRTVSGCVY
jgi:hypothetical protein